MKARKIVVWCVAVVGVCAPLAVFALSLWEAQRSSSWPLGWGWPLAAELLLTPGVYPGLMTRSWVVMIVVAALFWGVVCGAVAAMMLVRWKDRGPALCVLTVVGALAAGYGLLVFWMAAGWDPD